MLRELNPHFIVFSDLQLNLPSVQFLQVFLYILDIYLQPPHCDQL